MLTKPDILDAEGTPPPAAATKPARRQRNPAVLTHGPIGRTLVLFSLPILASNVLQSLNATINAVWVGRLIGPLALDASANGNSLFFFLISVGFGIGMAATILVGQSLGARNLDQAKRTIGTTLVFFGAVSVVLAGAGVALAPHMLTLMRTPPEALPLAAAYLRVIFLALPGIYFLMFFTMVLRGAGDSRTPFIFMTVATILDVALNPLFIRGWGPVPALGMGGAAFATLLAQWTGCIALVLWLYRSHHFLRLTREEFRHLRIDRAILRALIVKGIPMGLQMIVMSSSMIVMVSLVNGYGALTGAAYGAGFQLWNYIQMPAMAVGMAVSSMAAQNVGARNWQRVRRIAVAGIVYSVLLTGSLVLAVTLVDRAAFGLFLGGNDEAIGIARHMHLIVSWSFILFGITFVLSSVVRATGAVIPPLIILFVALWVVRVPFAVALMPSLHADAIWWSFPAGSVIALAMSIAYYRFGNWRKAHMLEG